MNMKRVVPSKELQMKKCLYRSNLLRNDEIVAFKKVYLILCQRSVKDRIGILKTSYETVLSAYKRDSYIVRLFYGILRSRKIKDKYESDIRKIYGKPHKLIHLFHKNQFGYK